MRLLGIFLLISASAFAQTITFKAYTEVTPAGSANSVATTTPLNIASNDTIVFCVGRGFGSTTVTSIDDGGSNSATLVKHADSGPGDSVGGVDIWVKTGATANASALFNALFSTSVNFRWMAVAHYSGIATASAVDQTSCNSAGCATATSSDFVTAQNVTTTQAAELLAACNYNNNTATIWAGQNSFNLRTGASNLDHQYIDKIVSSTGSYPGGNMASLSATTVGQVTAFATFKQDTGGGGSSVRKRVVVTQ